MNFCPRLVELTSPSPSVIWWWKSEYSQMITNFWTVDCRILIKLYYIGMYMFYSDFIYFLHVEIGRTVNTINTDKDHWKMHGGILNATSDILHDGILKDNSFFTWKQFLYDFFSPHFSTMLTIGVKPVISFNTFWWWFVSLHVAL